jgi:hypothetical protein
LWERNWVRRSRDLFSETGSGAGGLGQNQLGQCPVQELGKGAVRLEQGTGAGVAGRLGQWEQADWTKGNRRT